jgi:hypothetical protein
VLFAILEIVKDVARKTVGFQVLAMNLLLVIEQKHTNLTLEPY